MWSDTIKERINSIDTNANEDAYYAPYDKILNKSFSEDEFFISPQHHPVPTSKDSIDFVLEYIVQKKGIPVFFIEVKAENKLNNISNRYEADRQMRRRMAQLIDQCPLTVIKGFSVFGRRICKYEYNKNTRLFNIKYIEEDPSTITDVAPISNWNLHVVNDADQIQGYFNNIKTDCVQI